MLSSVSSVGPWEPSSSSKRQGYKDPVPNRALAGGVRWGFWGECPKISPLCLLLIFHWSDLQPLFPSRKIPSHRLSSTFDALGRLSFPSASRHHKSHLIESNSWDFDWVAFLQGIIISYFSVVVLKFWANIYQDITALIGLPSDFQIFREKYGFYVPVDFR